MEDESIQGRSAEKADIPSESEVEKIEATTMTEDKPSVTEEGSKESSEEKKSEEKSEEKPVEKSEQKPVEKSEENHVEQAEPTKRTPTRGKVRFGATPEKKKEFPEVKGEPTKVQLAQEEKEEPKLEARNSVKPVQGEARTGALTPEKRSRGKKYHEIQIVQLESEIEENGKYRYK